MARHFKNLNFLSRSVVVTFALFMTLSPLFQNCGQFTTSSETANSNLYQTTTGGADLVPMTDRLDVSCADKAEYDVCIYRKNPVAQYNSAINGNYDSELLTRQIYGVKLTGLSSSGKLENETFKIQTLTGIPISTTTDNLKSSVQNDSAHSIAQLNTYYWLERTLEYLEFRVGVLPVKGRALKVYIDDSLTGWSAESNSIHLQNTDTGKQMALNGDVAIHFLGQANLYHATNGAISAVPAETAKSKACGGFSDRCCTTINGCAGAISSGTGDYFVAMMFPEQPTVGETWANRLTGVGYCGLTRDLREADTKLANDFFNACASQEGQGDIYTMGTLWASIWWHIRQAAETQEPGASREVDTLFVRFQHLLTSDDDFKSALEKIKTTDQNLFNSKYSPRFTAEFQRRGL